MKWFLRRKFLSFVLTFTYSYITIRKLFIMIIKFIAHYSIFLKVTFLNNRYTTLSLCWRSNYDFTIGSLHFATTLFLCHSWNCSINFLYWLENCCTIFHLLLKLQHKFGKRDIRISQIKRLLLLKILFSWLIF